MKKLLLIIAVSIAQISWGAINPPLQNEITDKLILDLSEIELDENHSDFVRVNFRICEGRIELEEITGTQKELVQKVKNKLKQLFIEGTYDEEALYRYKFTFEKN